MKPKIVCAGCGGDMKTTILKPCVYCGTTETQLTEDDKPCLFVIHLGHLNYQVYCQTCDATGPLAESEVEARTCWNQRGKKDRAPRKNHRRSPYMTKKRIAKMAEQVKLESQMALVDADEMEGLDQAEIEASKKNTQRFLDRIRPK